MSAGIAKAIDKITYKATAFFPELFFTAFSPFIIILFGFLALVHVARQAALKDVFKRDNWFCQKRLGSNPSRFYFCLAVNLICKNYIRLFLFL
jgi:hypothetical protein